MGRRKRPAAETRTEILQAAKQRLQSVGPAGIRLDDVARDVGVTRQAILHYFNNRTTLIQAVVQVAWTELFTEISDVLSDSSLSLDELVEQVDRVARREGNARLGAWLLLSESGLPDTVFQDALAHASSTLKERTPDSEFVLLLIGTTLFGDAIFGGRLRSVLALADTEDSRTEFRQWLIRSLLTVG